MTGKSELQQTVNAQCGVIERLQIERDSALDEVRVLRSITVSAEVGGSLEDATELWMLQGNTVRGNAFASSDASEIHTVTIKRDDDGKWQALIDGATTSEEPEPQEPVEYDESKSERGPDSPRVPRDDDYLLAGQLSTVWPLSTFHPSESINLAIYLRDHMNVEPL